MEDTYGTTEDYVDCLSSSLFSEASIYEELYNLADDRRETQNLAQNREHSDRLEAMRARILEHGRAVLCEDGRPQTVPD